MKLLDFKLHNSYFQVYDKKYQNIFGCAMGCQISRVVANLVIGEVEETVIRLCQPSKMVVQCQYVNDNHFSFNRNYIQ